MFIKPVRIKLKIIALDQEKQLDRIKYSGEPKPNLDRLKNSKKKHLLKVPFENLDVTYTVPIELNF